jgi:hypothetical protein
MWISADLKCYHCGDVAGELVIDTAARGRLVAFRPTGPAATGARRPPRRCGRCGGPLYLDEAQTLSPHEAAAVLRARRVPPAATLCTGA